RIRASPTGQFVQTYALCKTIAARLEQLFSAFIILLPLYQSLQSLMMKGGDLHQALALSESSTPQLICFAQRGFATACRVFAQLTGVLVFKPRFCFRFAFGGHFHRLIPASLTTKTSASSAP